ncbi:universal stress protein [Gaopeijia maritima]|uniref:Universal stress protein n=1 Tax=Gaopeijia maritima TaxID=3119007 RepID=A0ABU9E673_9BACT
MTAAPIPTTYPEGKVLACIDESRYAEGVCDYARWSAGQMDAPLSLLHVIPHPPGGVVDASSNLTGAIGFGARKRLLEELAELDARRSRVAVEQGRHLLAAALERLAGEDLPSIETRQRHGELVDALVALEPETRMFVVGKRGTESEGEHGHLGSHLEQIIRALHRPVLIAQQTFAPPRRMLFAHDGSETARRGVQMVARSPLFRGVPCHVVSAGSDPSRYQPALDEAAEVFGKAGFEVTTAVVPGEPQTALPRYLEEHDVDLLIMGAYGHSRVHRFFLGSTTTEMLERCTVSLMVLR